MRDGLYAVTVFATVFCAAVNCYTWRLAYPLWAFAGEAFPAVHREYLRRLNPVITVPHVVMFFASLGAAVWPRAGHGGWRGWAVFGLAAAVVGVSAFGAGPVHDRFARSGLDEGGLRVLVRISLWRSVGLLVASAVLLWPG